MNGNLCVILAPLYLNISIIINPSHIPSPFRAPPHKEILPNCNAKYSDFDRHLGELQNYANQHLAMSYEYLLLATNFGTYVKNRPGFEKQFRALSDKAWNNGVELIKYITKRGGEHSFVVGAKQQLAPRVVELNELEALSVALANEKSLAVTAHHLHKAYSHPHQPHISTKGQVSAYDPEVAHYLDEKFIEGQAETIRKWSGFTNDLKNLIKLDAPPRDVSTALNVHLFDEYLLTQ